MPSATTKIGERTKNESSLALRWRPVSVRNAWSSTRSTAHLERRRLEPELGVADADDVAVEQLRLALQLGVVEQGAVGRVHVLDVGAPVAAEDPRVDAGGVAVLDLHVGVAGAADREAADQVEALALLEAAAALGDQPGVAAGRAGGEGRGVVEPGRVGRRGDRAAQVLERRARDPEQEQVEDDQEAELEGDGDRVVVHEPRRLLLDVEQEGRRPDRDLVAGAEPARGDPAGR